MELFEKKIPVNQLKIGMYVCQLDRPWAETGFPLQGLYIKDQSDIDLLAKYCQFVCIDEQRSRATSQSHLKPLSATTNKTATLRAVPTSRPNNSIDPTLWRRRHCVEHYRVTSSFLQEFRRAEPIISILEDQLIYLLDRITRMRRFDLEPVEESAADLVESVIRNPDALAWLCQIKKTRKPIYTHMIRLAVWGAIVGRQMGLNRFSLAHLTMTLMMTGIGKSKLSDQTLHTHNVFQHNTDYQLHLAETLYHLKNGNITGDDILGTIEGYCERHDGSGYPNNLSAGKIPFLSRTAGLIDTFDLMVHPFNEQQSISPANAIARLNKCKDSLFDPHLVETFVQAIGIYPTGSLVEINNGVIGIVVTQSYEKRMQASIIPLINHDKRRFEKFKVFDLNLTGSDPNCKSHLIIKRGLPFHLAPQRLLALAHEQLFEKKKNVIFRLFD